MAMKINEGTQTSIYSELLSGTEIPKFKLDIGAAGASSAFTGTLGAVTNLAGGTVTRIGGGSIVVTGGTVNTGTIFAQTIGTELKPTNEIATAVTLTGTATGTLVAASSGSIHYVTTLIVSVESAGRVSIASVTPTSPIIGTMTFAANGGLMAAPINPPIRTASGSALVFNQSGTGVIGLFVGGFTE